MSKTPGTPQDPIIVPSDSEEELQPANTAPEKVVSTNFSLKDFLPPNNKDSFKWQLEFWLHDPDFIKTFDAEMSALGYETSVNSQTVESLDSEELYMSDASEELFMGKP